MNEYIKTMRAKIGHDTLIYVGASVFIYKDGRVLLQKRKDDNTWAQHGGGMEIGETFEETAKRELLEETGLIADKFEFLGIFTGKEMLHTYPNGDKVCNVCAAYVCRDFFGELLNETNETTELKWFNVNDLPMNIAPTNKKPFEAFLEWCKRT